MESDGKQVYAGVGVCRRLKPNQHQACIKCPRCDSLNTKFCYYNNYNLSQPRHFCKGCRRYWTKGGVLRNVPVGGGCRKTKRSKPKLSVIPTNTSKKLKIKSNSNSKSGSESAGAVTSDVLSAISTNSSLPEFPESTINDHTSEADELIFKDDIGMMFDEIAGATSVIDMKFDEMPTVDFFDDQTAQGYWRNGGDGGGGSGLFDLTGSNDHHSFWSQTHGWGENDYSLNYFP